MERLVNIINNTYDFDHRQYSFQEDTASHSATIVAIDYIQNALDNKKMHLMR